MEKLVLENEYENVVPLFGAAFAVPNKKAQQFYTDFALSTMLSPTENRIQGLWVIFKYFSRQI